MNLNLVPSSLFPKLLKGLQNSNLGIKKDNTWKLPRSGIHARWTEGCGSCIMGVGYERGWNSEACTCSVWGVCRSGVIHVTNTKCSRHPSTWTSHWPAEKQYGGIATSPYNRVWWGLCKEDTIFEKSTSSYLDIGSHLLEDYHNDGESWSHCHWRWGLDPPLWTREREREKGSLTSL